MVHREEGDPHTAEHQHAECQEFGFGESVRKIPGQESLHEAEQGQGAQESQNTVEGSERALVSNNDDVSMFRVCICVNVGWTCPHPACTESELYQGADGDDVVWCP